MLRWWRGSFRQWQKEEENLGCTCTSSSSSSSSKLSSQPSSTTTRRTLPCEVGDPRVCTAQVRHCGTAETRNWDTQYQRTISPTSFQNYVAASVSFVSVIFTCLCATSRLWSILRLWCCVGIIFRLGVVLRNSACWAEIKIRGVSNRVWYSLVVGQQFLLRVFPCIVLVCDKLGSMFVCWVQHAYNT